MALATINDLMVRLGRDLTGDEIDRAEALLEDASASVTAYTGQSFTSEETTARLRVRNGHVRLPQRPVTEVDSIEDMNGNAISFDWFAGDRIAVPGNVIDSWAFEPWRNGIEWVDVTYTHGYATVPAEVVAVVVEKVLRGIGSGTTSVGLGGVQSVTLGDAAITYGSVGASGSAGFFDAERNVLDRYRRPIGTIQVAY